jgi:protein-S-isoprenylcysteine O-methyltransferase Ste14
MMLLAVKVIWCAGVIGWFVIRHPHARRSRKTPIAKAAHRPLELVLLAISTCGLGVAPALYVFAGLFRFADYPLQFWQPFAGGAVFAAALWLFHRTHKDLGRYWSVTLEMREQHRLISDGVYRHVRHPMYSAFWMWAIAQALLLPNWVAGFSGMVGFGCLYFVRVGREEAMMLAMFGEEYRAYMQRTSRIIPRLGRIQEK